MNIIFVALLIYASITDIKEREIPDIVPISIGLISITNFNPLGLLVVIPFLVAGYINLSNMGGGDIKLIASVGLFLGIERTIAGLIVGLSISLIWYFITKRKDERIPLAPFLAVGFILLGRF